MIETPDDETVIDPLADPEGGGQDPNLTDFKMPEPTRRGRVVLQHVTGPLAGVMRIMGLIEDAPNPLPDFLPEVDMLSHHAPVSLIAVKRSYVLYREVMDPEMNKMFDEAQQ